MSRGVPKAKRWRRLGAAPTEKIARVLQRKPYPPGEHGQSRRRTRPSTYKVQLTEKQRVQAQYGLTERQLSNYVSAAQRNVADPVTALLDRLERRLSTVVFRTFAPSMEAARQYINHGHVQVNGQRVAAPSYLLDVGDTVSIVTQSDSLKEAATNRASVPPPYLRVDPEALAVTLIARPTPEFVPVLGDVRGLLEFYS